MSPFSFWVTMVKYVPILRISTGALNSGFSRANQVGLLLLLPTQDVNQLQVPQPLPSKLSGRTNTTPVSLSSPTVDRERHLTQNS